MSENYSLKELNEWADKVIDCISKWADEMNKAFNGTPTSIKIEKLDFSEHDKVFEDEVADLKQRIRELIKEKDEYKRKCNAFGFENQDLKKITKGYEDKIAKLEENIGYYKDSFYRTEKNCDKLYNENKVLKQRIAELESKETETCEKEPKISDSAPSVEWYDNRHQSDCKEINRLNTTIDVLIHKVEYLRQFAGLE